MTVASSKELFLLEVLRSQYFTPEHVLFVLEMSPLGTKEEKKVYREARSEMRRGNV